jgi:hypothetical protein
MSLSLVIGAATAPMAVAAGASDRLVVAPT